MHQAQLGTDCFYFKTKIAKEYESNFNAHLQQL